MAKCDVCGKGALFGRQISITRSQVSGRANREWKSNVKSVKVKVNGGTKKMHVCTSCLRSGKVERAFIMVCKTGCSQVQGTKR